MDDALAPWRTTATRTLFQHRWHATIVEDDVVLPNGFVGTWLRYEQRKAVVQVLLVDGDGRALLLHRWSHGAGEVVVDLVAGGVERGEDVEAAAIRECREEAGIRPRHLEPLGRHLLRPARSPAEIHLFLGTDLVDDPLPPDAEELFVAEWVDPGDLATRIALGEVRNASVLSAWAVAVARGVLPPPPLGGSGPRTVS